MDAKSWGREMALYNQWQDEKLYAACATLSDDQRRADRGLFFASIHQTLDHIFLVSDRLFRYAARGERAGPFDPQKPMYDQFDDLRQATAELDQQLRNCFEENDNAFFAETLPFAADGVEGVRDYPRQLYLMQAFNHATHHRSQVTSELHRLGVDYGNTDLPFNPLSQFAP